MKNLSKAFGAAILLTLSITNASAQLVKAEAEEFKENIVATGFLDYPPVGYVTNIDANTRELHSVYQEVIEDLQQKTGRTIRYNTNADYKELVKQVRGGEIDLILGVYYETQLYEGLDLVFPSMLNNPISIILLPKNGNNLKNMEQLKTLKGGISDREHLSDYVKDELKDYNVEHFDNSYDMFEKLFTGKIDYVFASHFYGIVESSKLGLRDKLSFSKQIIWNMPLFFGVSKLSDSRNFLTGKLSSYSENPKNKEKLEKYLAKIIYEIELSNRGVVPPAYSLEQ